ncbi:hypothetical protein [Terrabacter sp. BE26]|uniref:hypothetical protein n=1 Tax=Terrabacter sp. BE26 TaxID=2898152 RepID=UPI0035BE3CDC
MAPEEASFTLPARPGVLLLVHDRIDLLAGDTVRRRIPEGTVSGFAIIGFLVLFSALVGGVTAGLVVVGVSTLLAASAALVTGQFSLEQVGGQRGASLLLGLGVAALILGSVGSPSRPAPALATDTPVPVSSRSAFQAQSTYAATTATEPAEPAALPGSVLGSVPGPVRSTAVAVTPAPDMVVATQSPGAEGLTLSPDALRPRTASPGDAKSDAEHGKGAGKRPAEGRADSAAKSQPAANSKALGKAKVAAKAHGKAKSIDKSKDKGSKDKGSKDKGKDKGEDKGKDKGKDKVAVTAKAVGKAGGKAVGKAGGKAGGKAKNKAKQGRPAAEGHGFAASVAAAHGLV